ncbi:hypothetical protein [Streptomyces sp. NPDC056452]|uniref:hypothetical protein n=1 Tax=Streptomyces sp. NPDC056452 TaxID=3345821 RepID=UPI0036CF45A7
MDTGNRSVGPEPQSGDRTRSRLASVPGFASATLALAALVVSIIAMVMQKDTAEEQTKLGVEQKELTREQTNLENRRDAEAARPKVSYWLLPTGSGDGILHIINKDKDPMTWFYIEAGGTQGSLNFVPPCTRTSIQLSPELVELFTADTDGWTARFHSAGKWWTFDKAWQVIRDTGLPSRSDVPELSWAGVTFTPEPDCET